MEKKRRKIENIETIDLRETNAYLYEKISIKRHAIEKEEVSMEYFDLDPNYGSGYIYGLKTQDIHITVSRFKLKKDLTYLQSLKNESIHLNFILTGKKSFKWKIVKTYFWKAGKPLWQASNIMRDILQYLGKNFLPKLK